MSLQSVPNGIILLFYNGYGRKAKSETIAEKNIIIDNTAYLED